MRLIVPRAVAKPFSRLGLFGAQGLYIGPADTVRVVDVMVFMLYNASFSSISIVSGKAGLWCAQDRACVRSRNVSFFGPSLLPSGTRTTRLIMDAQYQRQFWFQERMAELGRKRNVVRKSNAIQSCHPDGAQVDSGSEIQASDSFCMREGAKLSRSAGGESMRAEQSGVVRGAASMNPKESQVSRSLDEEDEVSCAFKEAATVHSDDCASSMVPKNSSAEVGAAVADADDGSSPLGSEVLRMELHEDDSSATKSLDTAKRAHPHTDMLADEVELDAPGPVSQDSETVPEAVSGSGVDPTAPRDTEAALQACNSAIEKALERSLEPLISEQSGNGTENASAPETATDSANTSEVPLANASQSDPTSQEKPYPSAFPRVSSGTPRSPLHWPIAKSRRIAEVLGVPGKRPAEKPNPKPSQVTSVDLGRERLDIVYAVRRGWRPGKTESDFGAPSTDPSATVEDPQQDSSPGSSFGSSSESPQVCPREPLSVDDAANGGPASAQSTSHGPFGARTKRTLIGPGHQIALRARQWILRLVQLVLSLLSVFRHLGRARRKPRV